MGVWVCGWVGGGGGRVGTGGWGVRGGAGERTTLSVTLITRRLLHKDRQQQREPFDSFITELLALVKSQDSIRDP